MKNRGQFEGPTVLCLCGVASRDMLESVAAGDGEAAKQIRMTPRPRMRTKESSSAWRGVTVKVPTKKAACPKKSKCVPKSRVGLKEQGEMLVTTSDDKLVGAGL